MLFKLIRKSLFALLLFILAGFLVPENFQLPVQGMNKSSYHPDSYWAYPWGKSITHKGVDVFAKKGTAVLAAAPGVVIFKGNNGAGGHSVLTLSPKWRIHYYAHLNEIKLDSKRFIKAGKTIGTVGDSGNAKGKPPHLHYVIVSLIPHIWKMDSGIQGYYKAIYLNPISLFEKNF